MDERRRRSFYVLTDSQVNSIAGATSGVFVSVLVSPLDVVRTRIQVKRLPKGVPDTPLFVTIYRLAKCEGLRVFYKGLGATLLGYVPNWAVYFTTYQWSKKKLAKIYPSLKNEHENFINLLASVTAGAVANTVIAPMWTIRTRMMTQKNHENYRNSFHAARKIAQIEGIYALYRGLIPSMLGLIHVAIQFPLYEYLKRILAKRHSNQRLSTGELMIASSLSKFVASFTAYPHEIVRSRLQDAGHARQNDQRPPTYHRDYRNVRDAIRTIAHEEGIRGFYRGIVPTLVRTVPAAVLTLSSYEKMREFLADRFGENSQSDDD